MTIRSHKKQEQQSGRDHGEGKRKTQEQARSEASKKQTGAWYQREVVFRLNSELVKILLQPEITKRLGHEITDMIGNTPKQAQAIVEADIAKRA